MFAAKVRDEDASTIHLTAMGPRHVAVINGPIAAIGTRDYRRLGSPLLRALIGHAVLLARAFPPPTLTATAACSMHATSSAFSLTA